MGHTTAPASAVRHLLTQVNEVIQGKSTPTPLLLRKGRAHRQAAPCSCGSPRLTAPDRGSTSARQPGSPRRPRLARCVQGACARIHGLPAANLLARRPGGSPLSITRLCHSRLRALRCTVTHSAGGWGERQGRDGLPPAEAQLPAARLAARPPVLCSIAPARRGCSAGPGALPTDAVAAAAWSRPALRGCAPRSAGKRIRRLFGVSCERALRSLSLPALRLLLSTPPTPTRSLIHPQKTA